MYLKERDQISYSSECGSSDQSSVDLEMRYVPKDVEEMQAQPELNAFETCALFRKADQSNLLELKMLFEAITEKQEITRNRENIDESVVCSLLNEYDHSQISANDPRHFCALDSSKESISLNRKTNEYMIEDHRFS